MPLADEDNHWIAEQLERVETRLLTEFHKWASRVEVRQRSHAAALRALDVEMESVSGSRSSRVERDRRMQPS